MSGPVMLLHLLLERLSRQELVREPEPQLIMDDPVQVAAFVASGGEEGVLAFTHLYHAVHMTALIRPGERVLDLACGPANQLAQLALLNPAAHFVGLDASANMLQRARDTLVRNGVHNVELVRGDMTCLQGIDDGSMDGVVCTMSLHHLPDQAALRATLREARRVLRPGGGIYFVDFGRFKRASTQRFFAFDRRDCQSEPFTRDYLQSLKAAFTLQELSEAAQLLGTGVLRHVTPLAPFMVVFKSAARRTMDRAAQQLVRQQHERLTPSQQRDLGVFARWFRGAGYALPCSLR